MKHTKFQNNFYISPLTGKKVVIPAKKENEMYSETAYRLSLEATQKAIETGVASFCAGSSIVDRKSLSMDF